MANNTYFFQHDYNPTNNHKIMGMLSQYGATGYGLYWRIVELLHSDTEHKLKTKKYIIEAIAKQMLSTSDFLLQFIDDCVNVYELFEQDHDMIFSDRVFRNIEHRERIINARKIAGSKGGTANAKQKLANAKQNVAIKEKKEKKLNKEYTPPTKDEVIAYFLKNGYSDSAAIKAFNYYDSANWVDSEGKKVLSWKQKMQGVWFKDENKIKQKQFQF